MHIVNYGKLHKKKHRRETEEGQMYEYFVQVLYLQKEKTKQYRNARDHTIGQVETVHSQRVVFPGGTD